VRASYGLLVVIDTDACCYCVTSVLHKNREGIMLRLEVIGLMVADAMRKGHLDICDKYSGAY
jgi:hypothetical protein